MVRTKKPGGTVMGFFSPVEKEKNTWNIQPPVLLLFEFTGLPAICSISANWYFLSGLNMGHLHAITGCISAGSEINELHLQGQPHKLTSTAARTVRNHPHLPRC
jgi:hypothetical protein